MSLYSFHFSSVFFFLSSCAYLLVLFDGAGQWIFPAPSREGVWEVWGGTGRAGGEELLRGEENGGSRGRAPAHILEERGARGERADAWGISET